MKKGDKVEISYKKEKLAYTTGWTEDFSGDIAIKKGTKLYHGSFEKLTSFYPTITCFSPSYELCRDYIYCIIPKQDIEAFLFNNNAEVRIDLEKMKDKVDIYYVGTGIIERFIDSKGFRDSRYSYKIKEVE